MVKDMRKILLFIIILLTYIGVVFIVKEDKTMPVFNELDNSYNIYTLDISKQNINTKNLLDYFDNIKILEVYPYINPIYKKLINLPNYSFNTALSNKKNISLFTSLYLRKIDDNSLSEELAKYKINGIKINKIKVYATNSIINHLIFDKNMKILSKK